MADETQTDEVPAESPEGETPSLSALDAKVNDIIETLKKIVSPGSDAPHEAEADEPQADPKAQMKEALKELQAEEKEKERRSAERRGTSERLDKIEQKIKERAPKEYRKITNAVWGRDED